MSKIHLTTEQSLRLAKMHVLTSNLNHLVDEMENDKYAQTAIGEKYQSIVDLNSLTVLQNLKQIQTSLMDIFQYLDNIDSLTS